MKICIVSDSHDRAEPLAAAIVKAQSLGAEAVIHCGDLIGANTLRTSLKLGIPLHVLHGNNVGDQMALHRMMSKQGGLMTYHGQDAELEWGGRRIFATHYPHYGRAMACTGDYDLVCCGHSHVAEIIWQPNIKGERTLLVNPGSVSGIGAPGIEEAFTWILGDLDKMIFEIHTQEH
ncbi:MAG: metallophosphoesterase family protein [Proteobacteria bacterium]|nr:metallophosphoesterase family protein [Pseudomonadota bacterium]